MTLAELGASVIYFLKINFLDPMQDAIKQQNTFTTIAAANTKVIASYCGCYEWFQQPSSSLQRHMATTSKLYTRKFKMKVVYGTCNHGYARQFSTYRQPLCGIYDHGEWHGRGFILQAINVLHQKKCLAIRDQILCVHTLWRILSSQTLLYIYTCMR